MYVRYIWNRFQISPPSLHVFIGLCVVGYLTLDLTLLQTALLETHKTIGMQYLIYTYYTHNVNCTVGPANKDTSLNYTTSLITKPIPMHLRTSQMKITSAWILAQLHHAPQTEYCNPRAYTPWVNWDTSLTLLYIQYTLKDILYTFSYCTPLIIIFYRMEEWRWTSAPQFMSTSSKSYTQL